MRDRTVTLTHLCDAGLGSFGYQALTLPGMLQSEASSCHPTDFLMSSWPEEPSQETKACLSRGGLGHTANSFNVAGFVHQVWAGSPPVLWPYLPRRMATGRSPS